MKFRLHVLCGVLALAGGLAASVAQAQSSPWFRADFNNLNASGSNMYNFANRYAQSTTTWQTTHTTNQGWNGTGAPHVVIHGCTGGGTCNDSEHQFNSGWVTPAVGGSRSMGDSAFIRFRIKFDPDTVFQQDTFGAKFMLFGQSSGSPNSRWIIHLLPPKQNQGCTVGFESYSYFPWTPPSFVWYRPQDWGLSSFAASSPYAGFQSSVNIGWWCVPSVLVTKSNHAAPVPKPQQRGDAPVGGWYHLQFQAQSGAPGAAAFRIWANNNAQTSPSSERTNLPDGLGVTGWNGGVEVGGYWGTAFPGTIGYIIDDFEIGPTFDPNWYPSGGPRPSAPTGVN